MCEDSSPNKYECYLWPFHALVTLPEVMIIRAVSSALTNTMVSKKNGTKLWNKCVLDEKRATGKEMQLYR